MIDYSIFTIMQTKRQKKLLHNPRESFWFFCSMAMIQFFNVSIFCVLRSLSIYRMARINFMKMKSLFSRLFNQPNKFVPNFMCFFLFLHPSRRKSPEMKTLSLPLFLKMAFNVKNLCNSKK